MRYDEVEKTVYININDNKEEFINIPISKVYQVIRGLVSASQKYYGKKSKTQRT